jgi:hypothetical protein
MSNQVSVPTCLTGSVSALQGVSTCNDGATHLLSTIKSIGAGQIRLKPWNEHVQADLDEAVKRKLVVTACGYLVDGGECTRLDTYAVGPSGIVGRHLHTMWEGDLPWPDVLRAPAAGVKAAASPTPRPRYQLGAHAVRVGNSIEVTVSAVLPSSCYEARIADWYPGGGRVYIQDPGAAQVFVQIAQRAGSNYCPLHIIRWAGSISIADSRHDKVQVFLNEADAVEVPVNQADEYVVISLTAGQPPNYMGCQIVPANAVYPAIYSRRYGPATHADCAQWISQHCGWD